MHIRITNPDSAFFGQEGQAKVIYFDIKHVGEGPDLCHVTFEGGGGISMLSSNFEVIPTPQPEDLSTGRCDKNGRMVRGGDRVTDGRSLFFVRWNEKEARWELERESGSYQYPTLQRLGEMVIVTGEVVSE